MPFAGRPERAARRDQHARAFKQLHGELLRVCKARRQLRPDEHRRARLINRPADRI